MKKIIIVVILLALNVYGNTNFNLSGQIRHRYEWNQKDFNADTGADNFHLLRTRFNATFNPGNGVEIFLQFQDARTFGEEENTLIDATADRLDLHQGYFKLNGFLQENLYLMAGRFEVKYGTERLMGAVGWSNTGRSFDGVKMGINYDNLNLELFRLREWETNSVNDSGDKNVSGMYLAGKNKILSGDILLINVSENETDNTLNTLGLHLNGSLNSLFYSLELAYQNGKKDTLDVNAYMFAVNCGLKLSRLDFSLAYELLSGGSSSTEYKTFNTLYATNHKFYGFMDYFLNIPVHTYNSGLIDIYSTVNLNAGNGSKIQIRAHKFQAHQELLLNSGKKSKNFGRELDLTAIIPYTASTKFVAGLSLFKPGEIFEEMWGKDTAQWFYLMTIINF